MIFSIFCLHSWICGEAAAVNVYQVKMLHFKAKLGVFFNAFLQSNYKWKMLCF